MPLPRQVRLLEFEYHDAWPPDRTLRDTLAPLGREQALGAVLDGGSLGFIFINSCKSFGYGVFLHQAGFVVVCWQTLVRDDAAAKFAAIFYEERAKGYSIQAAFNFVRQKIKVGDPKVVKRAAGIPRLLLYP